jgi:hypothetical protein
MVGDQASEVAQPDGGPVGLRVQIHPEFLLLVLQGLALVEKRSHVIHTVFQLREGLVDGVVHACEEGVVGLLYNLDTFPLHAKSLSALYH